MVYTMANLQNVYEKDSRNLAGVWIMVCFQCIRGDQGGAWARLISLESSNVTVTVASVAIIGVDKANNYIQNHNIERFILLILIEVANECWYWLRTKLKELDFEWFCE